MLVQPCTVSPHFSRGQRPRSMRTAHSCGMPTPNLPEPLQRADEGAGTPPVDDSNGRNRLISQLALILVGRQPDAIPLDRVGTHIGVLRQTGAEHDEIVIVAE